MGLWLEDAGWPQVVINSSNFMYRFRRPPGQREYRSPHPKGLLREGWLLAIESCQGSFGVQT